MVEITKYLFSLHDFVVIFCLILFHISGGEFCCLALVPHFNLHSMLLKFVWWKQISRAWINLYISLYAVGYNNLSMSEITVFSHTSSNEMASIIPDVNFYQWLVMHVYKIFIAWFLLGFKCIVHYSQEPAYIIMYSSHPGAWFNIKMLSYQYRKSHYGDKTILQPSYLHNGIS